MYCFRCSKDPRVHEDAHYPEDFRQNKNENQQWDEKDGKKTSDDDERYDYVITYVEDQQLPSNRMLDESSFEFGKFKMFKMIH